MTLRRVARALTAAIVVTPLAAFLPGGDVHSAARAAAAVANPPIEETCGIDLTVVLDASGSIDSSHAVDDVRDAADALLSALSNTNSTARVTQFASFAQQLAPSTDVDTASLSSDGALRKALNGYYNPIPPRPNGVTIHQYDGSGDPLSSSNYKTSNNSNQYTNWDQGLDQAADTSPELVMFVTDGDPTSFDFNQSGDPFNSGPPPDVSVNSDRSSASADLTLNRAVEESDRIKSQGTRMLAVGVGSALNNSASADRLTQIAGPQVVRDADLDSLDSLNDVDVALVTDFESLAAFMRGVVIQLCSPSLTIRKMAQTADSATYAPAPNWDVTVTPSVPGGGFDWLLPNTTPATSKTVSTDANGFAQFQWEPDPADANSQALVEEDLKANYSAGRPDDPDYRCEARDEDGNVRPVEGDFADPNAPSFTLDPIRQEIVTCTLYNSFDYEPDIALTKVNAPTEVRGDLDPPATVTSTYHVTNPGNTPLSGIHGEDDQCGVPQPVPTSGPNVGDTSPENGKLDPGEDWQFTCERSISTPGSTDEDGQNIVNHAEVAGTDPAGTTVSAMAHDDVDAFNPAISLTKLVDGQDSVTVQSGDPVTYTYAASNTGNTPLGSVVLDDDTPPCQDPTRGADDPGNDDAILDVGETWTYSCDLAQPTEAVIDTATVTAVPLNPLDNDNPFPDPNPSVTDTDTAEVHVVNPDISLTKSVTPDLVLLGPGPPTPPEPVTYTFEATNNGDAPLNRPGAAGGGPGPTDPGWVVDSRCAPVTYVSGDDGNELLDPDETWQFTCTGEVTRLTVNVARITGQPSDDQGDPLPVGPVSDLAAAVVRVVRPGIEVTKTAVRGVVVDPDADAVSGPDVPRRPAEYLYDVVNTGDVPLSLDPDPPTDNICGPLEFGSGDDNSNELLDPDEVWTYTCATTLQRQQATPPPTGSESGLVTNTVTATGVPFFDGALVPDKTVSDQDTAQVLVIEPGLTITKTASADVVRADSDVTYTFVVRNTGDVGLEVVGPTDDKCAPEMTGGDTNHNGLLDGADSAAPEAWTYECVRTLGLPAPPDTADVNTAEVAGIDPLGNRYEATDNVEVRVIDPAINLTKTVSKTLVPAGTKVTYGFDVTNIGQSPIATDDVLADIRLQDVASPGQPDCRTPDLVSKDGGNQDEFLDRDPAETWRYDCIATINESTTNVAAVRGTGGTQFDLSIGVFDADAAFVQTFHPGISVEKTADPEVLLGPGQVTYTYKVRNTGDVPLAGVEDGITDDTCSPLTYVSGDQDGDGLLDTPNSIFEDSLDETWTFRCVTNVTETTTNTVTTPGTPVDPGGDPLCAPVPGLVAHVAAAAAAQTTCDVTDLDRARVRVVEPGTITISKVTDPATSQPFSFALGGADFTLRDGDTRTYDGLQPGTYQLHESEATGWRVRNLVCHDATGDTTVDREDGHAEIHLAEGETVACTFTNVREGGTLPQTGENPPGSTGPSGGILPGTGAPAWLEWLWLLGSLLVLVGSELAYWSRRRQAVSV